MMAQRSDALTNLLLSSAALHGLNGTERVAPYFRDAWHAAARGDAPERKLITADIARLLLRDVLDICDAEGVARIDLVEEFNSHLARSEGNAVERLARHLLYLLDVWTVAIAKENSRG